MNPLSSRRGLLRTPQHPAHTPSPLSRHDNVLAASTSSIRTAASRASSATSASSSLLSIRNALADLEDEDIHFFDELISLLPAGAADFGQLHQAYEKYMLSGARHLSINDAGATRSDRDKAREEEQEERLWDLIHKLFKVKGTDWKERWGHARLALGYGSGPSDEEASFADEDEPTQQSGTNTGGSTSDEGASSQNGSDQTASPTLGASLRIQGELGLTAERSPRRMTQNTGALIGMGVRDYLSRSRSELDRQSDSDAEESHSSENARDLRQHRALLSLRRMKNLNLNDDTDRSSLSPTPPPYEYITQETDYSVSPRAPLSTEKSPAVRHSGVRTRILPRVENSGDDLSLHQRTPLDRKPRGAAAAHFEQVIQASRDSRQAAKDAFQEEAETEREQREAENVALAVRWYDGRLLQRSFWWWLECHEKHQSLYSKVSAAKDGLVVRRCVESWREALARRLRKQKLASKADTLRIKLTVWRRWKRISKDRKEERADAKIEQLRSIYKETSTLHKQRIVRSTFHQWQERTAEHKAATFRSNHLRFGAFALWKLRAAQKHIVNLRQHNLLAKRDARIKNQVWSAWTLSVQLRSKAETFSLQVDERIVAQAFAAWRKATVLQSLHNAFSDHRLKRLAFSSWVRAKADHQQVRREVGIADRRRNRKLKKVAFVKWRTALIHSKSLQVSADAFLATQDDRKKRSALRLWRLSLSANRLLEHKEINHVSATFKTWRHRTHQVRKRAEQKEQQLQKTWNGRIQLHALATWRKRAANQRSVEASMTRAYQTSLISRSLGKWREQVQDRRTKLESAVASDKARLVKHAFEHWRQRLREQAADRILAQQRRSKLREHFNLWRKASSARRRDRLSVAAMRYKIDDRIQRDALKKWTTKIIDLKSRLLEVAEERDLKLISAGWGAWTRALDKARDREARLESFVQIRDQDLLGSSFDRWRAAAHTAQNRRQKLDDFLENKSQRIKTTVWATWYDKLQDQLLRPAEYQVLMMRKEVVQAAVMKRWVAQTRILPAIRFRNLTLKRQALEHWASQYPRAQLVRTGREHDRRTLLAQCWKAWKGAVRDRQTWRAAARFGGTSANRLRVISGRSALRPARFSSPPSHSTR